MDANISKGESNYIRWRFLPYFFAMAFAAFSLMLALHYAGVSLFGSSIVVAYSEGWISFKSAAIGLSALGISSGAAISILSNVTVGDVLGEAAAAALIDETILAWMGPWSLVLLGSIIAIAV